MRQFTRRGALVAALGALTGVPRRRAMAAPPGDGVLRYVNERRYQVTHSAVVEVGDVALRRLEIWLPVPMDQPEQEIRSLVIKPEVPVVRDVGGQAAVAKLYRTEDGPGTNSPLSEGDSPIFAPRKSGQSPSGQSVRLEVSYQIACREIVPVETALTEYRLRPYRQDDQYRHFTRPETKIEAGLPAIVEAAKKLRAGRRTPLDVARAAYDWVLERTKYQLIDGLGGAAYCLNKGHGECGDYSALFVALCRAAGIPARPVTGFWADKTDGWHCWAEFMLPCGQWIPVDPSIGDRNAEKRKRYFGGLDNRRVALAKTYDVLLENSPVGHQQIDFLQVGAWWWHSSESLEGKRRPKARFSAAGKPVEA